MRYFYIFIGIKGENTYFPHEKIARWTFIMNNHLSNFASYDMNKAADHSGTYDRQPRRRRRKHYIKYV